MTRTISASTLGKIEAIIRDHKQITTTELATESELSISVVQRYASALLKLDKIHKVKRIGAACGLGAIWAPGAGLIDDEGDADVEPVQVTIKRWAGCPPRGWMDVLLFGAAGVREVHA